jgi:pectate lyase
MLLRTALALAGLAVTAGAADRIDPSWMRQADDWHKGPEAAAIADNILSHQTEEGGWPKDLDTFGRPRQPGDNAVRRATFDNAATTTELRFLGKVLARRRDPALLGSFERGLDHILAAQYPSGGFPQSHPPGRGYERHITFNDDAMARVLALLRDIARSPEFAFVGESRRREAQAAFDKGVGCILRCQVRIGGMPAAWGAQHDRDTLAPAAARSYELPSLSSQETAGVVRLLMSVPHPSVEIRQSVEGAVDWLRSTRIDNLRIDRSGGDTRVVVEAGAPPVWARFRDLTTGQPLFADRDGQPKTSLASIGPERRNGYAWYVTVPRALLDRDYPEWRRANP